MSSLKDSETIASLQRKGVYQSTEEMIGRTPLLRLSKSLTKIPVGRWLKAQNAAAKPVGLKSSLFAKIEMDNPGGSVKDRIAKNIIERAEARGDLKPGGTIVEATSGNTGAGLAVVSAVRGYKTIFVMPDKMSSEKINALRAFGSKVVVAPSSVGPTDPDYYLNVAKRISQQIPGAFLANQYFTPDNPGAHFETTGPEIWDQMEGKIDAFVAGIGTGGTLSGTARFLKSKNPNIRIVAVDPAGSIYAKMILEGKLVGAGKYLVEGVGEDMIPGTMDLKMPTEVVTTYDDESFAATRMLAQREGLLVGGSCGGAFFGAIQFLLAHESKGGAPLRAAVLLPDSGSRYLTKVFNEKWLKNHHVDSTWNEEALGGEVEYLPTAKKVEGV